MISGDWESAWLDEEVDESVFGAMGGRYEGLGQGILRGDVGGRHGMGMDCFMAVLAVFRDLNGNVGW